MMPQVRPLKNPPITEGLVDLRVDTCNFSRDKLGGIAEKVKGQYPISRQQHQFQTRLESTGGGIPETETRDLGLRGGQFFTEDRLQIVQFRSDGFTLNRLSPYSGWENVFPEAMKLWRLFVDEFEPETVKRLTVRYINHIPLQGLRVDLGDYLRAPVPVPQELNHGLTSLLTSVVLADPDSQCSVKITQALEPPHPGSNLALLLDIEAWRDGDWEVGDPGVERAFADLRDLKNNAFFHSLQDTVIERFE